MPKKLADLRAEFPELAGLDDEAAVDALHQAFYADLDRGALADALGVKPPAPKAEPSSMLRRVAGDTGVSLLKGAIAVPEAAVGLADVVTGGRAGKMAESAGFRPAEARQMLDEWYSPEQRAAFEEVRNADGIMAKTGAALRNPSVIAQSVAESLPSMGAGGVAARGLMAAVPRVAPVVAGAVGEGIVGAGSAAEQVRQQTADGLLAPQQAQLAAGSGLATGLLGYLGGKVAKSLGIADVDTMLAGAARDPAVAKGVVRRVIEGAVAEGVLEELPQSVQEQVAQNMALGKPLEEGVDEAAVMGVLTGGLMGGGAQLMPQPKAPTGPLQRAVQRGVDSGAVPAAGTPQPAAVPDAGAVQPPPGEPPAGGPPPARREAAQSGVTELVDAEKQRAQREAAERALFERTYPGADAAPAEDPPTGLPVEQADPMPPVEAQALDPFTGQPATAQPTSRVDPDVALARMEQAAQRREKAARSEAIAAEKAAAKEREGAIEAEIAANVAAASEPELDPPLPTDILNKDGKPFKSRLPALRAVRMNPGTALAMVQGGYALRRTPEIANAQRPGVAGAAGQPAGTADGGSGDAGRSLGDMGGEPADAGGAVGGAAGAPVAGVRAPEPVGDAGQPDAALIEQAANEAATSPANDLPEPTQGQKEAGNYKLGHATWNGLGLSFENPKGSERKGVDPDGKPWSVTMPAHYGYVKRTEGADGDHVDIYMGEHPESPQVFVVDQRDADTGKFDEHKVVLGTRSLDEATALYDAGFSDGKGPQRRDAVTPMTVDEFKAWLKDGDTTKPMADAGSEMTALRQKWPGLGDKSDEHVRAADEWDRAQRRVRGMYDFKQPGDALINRIEQEVIAARGGQAGVAKDQVGYLRALTGRLNAEAEREDTRGTLEHARRDRKDRQRRADMAAAMDKALDDEIDLSSKRLGKLANQGRLNADDVEKIAGAGDKFDTARAMDEVARSKDVPAQEGNQKRGEAANDDDQNHPQGDQPEAAQAAPGEAAELKPKAGKPRMGESADDVWKAIKTAAGGIVSREGGSRILYPTLRVVGGDDFRVTPQGTLEIVDRKSGGAGVRDASEAESAEFHRDLERDGVQVLLMTAPGYGSGYVAQKVVQELHSPAGLSFSKGEPAKPAGQPRAAELAAARPAAVQREPSDMAEPADTVPAPRKSVRKVEQARAARESKRADYFAPGNVVKAYGGELDEVLKYTVKPDGGFTVDVHRVKQDENGQWVRVGKPQDARRHSTEPEARAIEQGPVVRLPYQPAAEVRYDEPRADGKPFPNAVDRGIALPQAQVDGERTPVSTPGASTGLQEPPAVAGEESSSASSAASVRTSEAARAPVVQAVQSAAFQLVEHVTGRGKTLRGVVRTDLTLARAREIDRYTFKKDGGYFIREEHLTALPPAGEPAAAPADPVEKPEGVRARRERAVAEREAQAGAAAVAKLRDVGRKLAEEGESEHGRDRLANTHRRASMAASAEAKAAKSISLGRTIMRLADAIEAGEVKALAGVKTKAAVEVIDNARTQAMYARERAENWSYAEQQRQKGRAFEPADLNHVDYPSDAKGLDGWREALLNGLKGKRGTAELQAKVRRAPGVGPELFDALKQHLDDKAIDNALGWYARETVARQKRMAAAGILGPEQMREAVREYNELLVDRPKVDPIKEAERALVGQKVGMDFFPTPKPVATRMARMAGIEKGMRVLEPSAGNGHLADAARDAGATVDAVEISDTLRKILEAKGHTIAGRDFNDYEPTEPYDAVLMNPPFSDRRDAEHIQRAFGMLKPGGRLVAIAGEGVFNGSDKKAQAFRDWLDGLGAEIEALPESTFKGADLPAQTSANARMVIIEKADDTRFSRSGEDKTERAALRAISDNDELFALPRSGGLTVESIAADIDPAIKVKAHPAEGLDRYELTMPDGAKASIFVRDPSPYGPHSYGNTYNDQNEISRAETVRPGEHPEAVAPDVQDVWIDVSKLSTGSGGYKVYGIAGAFAHNTGAMFIGDPAGLSDEAMRRRSEAMLSLALRHGTSNFLAPHPRQRDGSPALGVPPLAWDYTDDLGNIRRLVALNVAAMDNAFPAAKKVDFDVAAGQFRNAVTGRTLDRDRLGRRLFRLRSEGAAAPGAAQAGGRTVARAAVWRALLREGSGEGQGSGGRDGLLARLAASSGASAASLKGLFSRRPGGKGVPMADAEAVRAAIRTELPGAPAIYLHDSIDKAPAALLDSIRAQGAYDIEAAFHGGEIHVFPGNIASIERMLFVVGRHEIRHYGMHALVPDQRQLGALMHAMWSANQNLRVAAAKVQKAGHAKSRTAAVEEALADMPVEDIEALTGWDRMVAAVRQWLRRMAAALRRAGFAGLAKSINPSTWTDRDVAAFVARAEDVARSGGRAGPGEAFSRAGSTVGYGRAEADQSSATSSEGGRQFLGAESVGRDAELDQGFADSGADTRFSRAGSIADTLATAATKKGLTDLYNDLTTSQEGFGWWHKTIGTQYQKAARNADFKRVYDGAQTYLHDTSAFANDAAGQAPTLLPQLKSWRDVLRPIALAEKDRAAVAEAVFKGTLDLTRDAEGALVPAGDEDAPGVVFSDDELGAMGLDDRQRALYREYRASVDRSLDILVAGDVARMMGKDLPPAIKQMVSDGDTGRFKGLVKTFLAEKASEAQAAAAAVRKRHKAEKGALDRAHATEIRTTKTASTIARNARHEEEQAALADRHGRERDAAEATERMWKGLQDRVVGKYMRIDELKERGYAPLMRFGRYSVYVTRDGADGEREQVYFGLYETQREANKAAREFREQAEAGVTVQQGVLSEEGYKLFSGMSPETMAVFADLAGMERNEQFEAYLKLALANRSALKRLIRRKGTAGYSEDLARVLASFVTSNARAASGSLHLADMADAIGDMQEKRAAGDVIDEAIKLREYVQNPTEEAQAVRGLLFAQYLGGSVASAMVNMTQPFTMTFPFLSQYGGPAKAGARLLDGMRLALGRAKPNSELARALDKAEKEGVVSPQEIHQLQAEAARNVGNRPWVRKGVFLWGSLFSLAEQFNRRASFIAAWNTAKAEGMADPFAFAADAVDQTQGVYNRANKPNWARGALGGTLFTFKQFSISYMEFLGRLPPRERALALAVLLLAAGAEGLPFADDLDDVIDTLAQQAGYDFNSKQAKARFLTGVIGRGGADFMLHGFSAIPGFPLDVSARMSVGNLIPGTGLLLRSETDKGRGMQELLGPVGSLGADALKLAESRDPLAIVPTAIRNLAKGLEMLQTGEYRDTRGRKVMDVSAGDAITKMVGFQPADVARESRSMRENRQQVGLARVEESEIVSQWAAAVVEKKPEGVQAARQRLRDWNAKNPQSPIAISQSQIVRKVRDMRMTREQRFEKAAPKEMRRMLQ